MSDNTKLIELEIKLDRLSNIGNQIVMMTLGTSVVILLVGALIIFIKFTYNVLAR